MNTYSQQHTSGSRIKLEHNSSRPTHMRSLNLTIKLEDDTAYDPDCVPTFLSPYAGEAVSFDATKPHVVKIKIKKPHNCQ